MDSPLDDPRSPYLRIVEDLRRSIAVGDLPPGEKLPSNAELKRRYDVASQTAQNAINALKAENLVYGVAGKGVFVRSDIDFDAIQTVTSDHKQTDETLQEVLARIDALESKVADLESRLSSGKKTP